MHNIQTYFPGLPAEQYVCFEQMGPLYREWNEKINVISRKDIGDLYERHVLHSLAIAKVIKFTPGTKILDVGTGGGFPGIPLSVMFPESEFLLIDSIGKKIRVVEAVAKGLGLKNVRARQVRVEEVKEKFDFVVSRAVTAFPDFVSIARKNVSPLSKNAMPNGIFYLKGGDFNTEIEPFRKTIEVFDIPRFFSEPFFETKKVIYLPVR